MKIEELIAFTLNLGDNIVVQENESYLSLYREPRIRGENRIVGIEQRRDHIKLHLPKNLSFQVYIERLNLWNDAYSKNDRGYAFLNHVDNDDKVTIAKRLIQHAYESINK
jgi:hypothetical protein